MKIGGINANSSPWMREHLHGEDIEIDGYKAVYEPKTAGFWGEPARLYIWEGENDCYFQVYPDEWEKKGSVIRLLPKKEAKITIPIQVFGILVEISFFPLRANRLRDAYFSLLLPTREAYYAVV